MNDDIVLSKKEKENLIELKMKQIKETLNKALRTKIQSEEILHRHCWHSFNETDYICCWCGEVSVEFHGRFNPDRKDND